MGEPTTLVYREARPKARWLWLAVVGCVLYGLALASARGFSEFPWPATAPAGTVLATVLWAHRGRRRLWIADLDGLTVEQAPGRILRLHWSQIQTFSRSGILIYEMDGRIHVLNTASPQSRVHVLLRERWLVSRRDRHSPPLAGAEIEALLRLPPGGTLHLRRGWESWLKWSPHVAAVLGLALALGLRLDARAVAAVLAVPVCWCFPFLYAERTAEVRRAGACGLTIEHGRGTCLVGWDEMLSIEHGRRRSIARTLDRSLVLHTVTHSGAVLAKAVDRVLAARSEGRLPPRMTDLSAAALSRASVTIGAERGLSRAEGGDG